MQKESLDEVIRTIDRGNWNMSDERAFMENLFVSRFNSFLTVFALFITAGFANNFTQMKAAVFYFGAAVLLAVWFSLHRAYIKYDRIIKLLSATPGHPIRQINQILAIESGRPDIKPEHNPLYFRASLVMGMVIPGLCIFILVLAGFATSLGMFG